MPHFTLELTYELPVYVHRTIEADTLEAAITFAMDNEDWEQSKEDYDSSGPTYVTGAWTGEQDHVEANAVPIPTAYTREAVTRPAQPRPSATAYLVQGQSTVPGNPMGLYLTKSAAAAYAAELVNAMRNEKIASDRCTASNWQKTLRAMQMEAAVDAGIDKAAVDGFSPEALADALADFLEDDWFDVWITQLPIGDTPTGDYLARFPETARPFCDRAYQDGFEDGLNSGGVPADAVAALKTARALLDEALTVHIYDEENGEKPPADDPYVRAIAQMDTVIARAEANGQFDIGRLVVVIEGGQLQNVLSDGPLIGMDVTLIDYDTDTAEDGQTEPIANLDGTTAEAYVGALTIEASAIIFPDHPLPAPTAEELGFPTT